MKPANEALLRDWERARASEGSKPRDTNRHALERLEKHCGGKPLDTLDRDQIRDWLAEGMEGLSSGTRHTYFGTARAFYNFLAADDIIPASPMAGMKEPKKTATPVPIPSDDDVRLLLKTVGADKSPRGKRDEAMIRIMLDTGGPRASEVATMLIAGAAPKPRDVLGLDLARDVITVTGKGDKTRTWPVSSKTARAASRWVRAREGLRGAEGSPRLWIGFRAKPGAEFTRSGVQDVLERRCDEAGIRRIHPHQCRHFAYHHFLLAGGRKGDAMTLFGWDDETMPNHYAAALQDQRALAAGTMLAIGDQW